MCPILFLKEIYFIRFLSDIKGAFIIVTKLGTMSCFLIHSFEGVAKKEKLKGSDYLNR